MSMSPFSFSVVVYHDYNKNTGESNYHRQQGMGFADSFAQAAGIIENFYGSDLISIQKLELFEDSDLILMPRPVLMSISAVSLARIMRMYLSLVTPKGIFSVT